jgi:DNA helicase TIP49 (TBP-interacting protein)
MVGSEVYSAEIKKTGVMENFRRSIECFIIKEIKKECEEVIELSPRRNCRHPMGEIR